MRKEMQKQWTAAVNHSVESWISSEHLLQGKKAIVYIIRKTSNIALWRRYCLAIGNHGDNAAP